MNSRKYFCGVKFRSFEERESFLIAYWVWPGHDQMSLVITPKYFTKFNGYVLSRFRDRLQISLLILSEFTRIN